MVGRQLQRNIEEENKRSAILIVKETEELAAQIEANITIINATAAATVIRLGEEAKAEATKYAAEVDGLGLEYLFNATGIQDPLIKQKYIEYFSFVDTLLI